MLKASKITKTAPFNANTDYMDLSTAHDFFLFERNFVPTASFLPSVTEYGKQPLTENDDEHKKHFKSNLCYALPKACIFRLETVERVSQYE